MAKHNVSTGINKAQLKHLGHFASPAVLEAGHNTAHDVKDIINTRQCAQNAQARELGFPVPFPNAKCGDK